MTRRRRRSGYTLLEMLVVLAILLVLGAVFIPTLTGMFQDSRTKLAADLVAGKLSEARSLAVEQGRPYRVLVSADGKKVRVEPDDPDGLLAQQPDGSGPKPFSSEDPVPDKVTLTVLSTDGAAPATDASGWTPVATYLNDGTCREKASEVQVQEPGVTPLVVRVRGLTGGRTVNRAATATQQPQGGARP